MTARVRIDSIAAGGDGVGRSDGLAVFVPRTAPGDLVDVRLEAHGRFARGTVTKLVEESASRVTPPCLHYTRDGCGGCQLQHLGYDAQLDAKSAIVRDALQRIGKRKVPTVPVEASPSAWAYRSKLTLALRWKGQRWVAGLHRYDDPDVIFELEQCPITDDRVLAIWRAILAASSALPRARRLRGAVRLTDDGASFVLEGATHWTTARELADRVPDLRSIWWQPEGRRRGIVIDRRGPVDSGPDTHDVRTPDASFAQVNTGMAAQLHAHVVSLAMARQPASAIDGYAGAGATAISLAERHVRVTAIELDAAAARFVGARLPAASRSIVGRVEDVIGSALPVDVVILNPPRAGVHERVTAALQDTVAARAIIYVSCNPATLARDVQRLPRHRIASVRSFDMFPQTAHVETVCELVPEAA